VSSRHEPVEGIPALESTTSPVVSVDQSDAVVEALAAEGGPVRMRLSPYQAVRVRTIDAYVPPLDDEAGFLPFRVLEVQDSLWIEELRADAAQVNHTATFMDDARHFLLMAGDSVVEVVAWNLEWSSVSGSGRHPETPPDPGWP
jgi:hypothetical protein